MQAFYWLIFLTAVGIAVFAVQNSDAPLVMIKFLLWRFETSLIYALLSSTGVGILISLFFWLPWVIRTSARSRERKREIKNLETMLHRPASPVQEGNKAKVS